MDPNLKLDLVNLGIGYETNQMVTNFIISSSVCAKIRIFAENESIWVLRRINSAFSYQAGSLLVISMLVTDVVDEML